MLNGGKTWERNGTIAGKDPCVNTHCLAQKEIVKIQVWSNKTTSATTGAGQDTGYVGKPLCSPHVCAFKIVLTVSRSFAEC